MSYQINPCHEWGDHTECPGCAHESHWNPKDYASEPAPAPLDETQAKALNEAFRKSLSENPRRERAAPTYTNEEIIERVERAKRDTDKLQHIPLKEEEAEKMLAMKYCEERFDTDQEAGAPYHAYLAGLREGKRSRDGEVAELQRKYDFRGRTIEGMEEQGKAMCRECEAQLAAAQEEVRKLETARQNLRQGLRDCMNDNYKGSEDALIVEMDHMKAERDAAQAEVAKLREENERLIREAIDAHKESARLRELLKVAEGALEIQIVLVRDVQTPSNKIAIAVNNVAVDALVRIRQGIAEGEKKDG